MRPNTLFPWRFFKASTIQFLGVKTEISKGIMLASLFINILALVFPLALLQVYDRIIPNAAYETLLLLVIAVCSALLLEALLRVGRTVISAWADARFEHMTGCKAFEHLLKAQIDQYEKEGPGAHFERLNALHSLKDFYTGQAVTVMFDLPFVLVFLILIAHIAGWLVLVPIIILSAFACAVLFMGKSFHGLLDHRRQEDDRRLNFIVEVLSGIHVVKSMAMEAQMLRRYERLQKTTSVTNYFLSNKSGIGTALTFIITQLSLVMLVGFGSLSVMTGSLTIGGLAACTLLTGRSLQPVGRAMSLWSRLQAIKIASARLAEVHKLPCENKSDSQKLDKVVGSIEFRNMSFSYADNVEPLFQDVNLYIDAKESIAIIGDNQSGKTTLLELMMGLIKPTSGEVKLDGHTLADLDVASIRHNIAYLPQNGILFNGTILENITMFCDADRDKAIAVSERLALYDEINHLPKGFDTIVGDRAVDMLSRGMTQRIAIARALLGKPPIVLFDEANTAIDMSADAVLKNMLEMIKNHCTLIIVSHRPSIINIADKIYTIKDKKLFNTEDLKRTKESIRAR